MLVRSPLLPVYRDPVLADVNRDVARFETGHGRCQQDSIAGLIDADRKPLSRAHAGGCVLLPKELRWWIRPCSARAATSE
jgi:hypothetical protein